MRSSKQNPKVVFTGGHAATTALATIQELQSRPGFKSRIYWIGSNRAIEGRAGVGIEGSVFPDLGVVSHYITAGRVQRRFTRHTLPSLLKIPVGVIQAFLILLKIRPQIIVSFGGYAGYPGVLAGWILRIPIILHEQTIATGLANKASSYFSNKIAISRSESTAFFPKRKIVVTGNPILQQIKKVKTQTHKKNPPVIFITGGSRGSQIINNTVDKILENLLAHYKVIHQVGSADYSHFLSRKAKLAKEYSNKYTVYETINPLEIASFYEQADLYLGRAGANTASEIIATRRHAILIPIPWTRFDEQNKNAKKAADYGLAFILPQENLNPKNLLSAIEDQLANWDRIHKNIHIPPANPDLNGAKNLVDLINQFI